ncbi:hypothetical protein LTR37_009840 [Vermiconidia calcicola]|uniref:Uncharacterized protein n=1 Tax=Vermiconidia calcicola TaxID=1690605 RepID=A0ACC3N783_9PEZI|nr:hypothetical protein LTR37_009840 [Vermiconidia calcicola]
MSLLRMCNACSAWIDDIDLDKYLQFSLQALHICLQKNSRRRSPDDSVLRQVFSAGFHDDHGVYRDEHEHAQRGDKDEDDQQVDDLETRTSLSPEKPEDGKMGEGLEEVESQDQEPTGDDNKDDRAGRNADLEKAPSLRRQQTGKSSRSQRQKDPNMVSWNGPDDPENPKNWTLKRKWIATFVVSSFTFISPVASAMVAPALPQMAQDLGVNSEVESQMMLSIFLLAYAVGPLFLGPLSEVYGRVPVLQLANLIFLVFNLACGFTQNGAAMIACRFFAGIGGSAPLAIGGGILADCFHAEQRGQAIAIYSLAPLLGPAAGPVAGGFISQNMSWRWVFWIVSIADAVVQISGVFFLQETWAPKLLEQKAARLRKETGNAQLYAEMSNRQSVVQKLETSLSRPFRLLFTQPIIVALAIYMAYLYGLVYLVISSFSALYTSPEYYNESVQIGGLHYIALATGYFLGAQITSYFNDWLYRRLKKQAGGIGQPEFRVPVMIPCAILLPAGLFWYGWSAEACLHWIMPDVGAAILAAATICGYQSIQTYVIDAYTKYAASAVASITTLRSLAGFAFPLFAPELYNSLGYGWGNSVLAFVAIAIGVPAPWVFWHYGARLRAKSQFAAGQG